MKKLGLILVGFAAAVAIADTAQVWLTSRSVVVWDAPADLTRTGWNVVLVNSATAATNMYASEAARAADAANTNGVLRWMVVSDPNVTRLEGLVRGLNWSSGNVWVSSRDGNGNYSDWSGPNVYNPNPSNVRVK